MREAGAPAVAQRGAISCHRLCQNYQGQTVLNSTRPSKENSLFLNAGDEFQGTLFYNFYKGWRTADTLNQLGVDAMTLGNHEFDGGDEELAAFINNITFPILAANLQSTNPTLNSSVKPYVIFEQYSLAVIGVITPETSQLSNPGNGTTFTDPVVAVQAAIDEIKATTDINRIVALTHIGYAEDIKLAEQTTGLSLIIGGHSHTALGNITGSHGSYPTIADNKEGEEVFIVTAYRWGEYLGFIDIKYDASGHVLEYHGAPIHLTNQTKQDPDLQAQIDTWREPFQEFANEVVGESAVELVQETCQVEECTLGDLMADAIISYRQDTDFSIINAGGIRASIDIGPITRGEVLTSFPFGNAIVELSLSGQQVWEVLEGIVSGVNQANGRAVTSFLQVSSGLRIVYDTAGEVGGRLSNVTVAGAPLDLAESYQVATLDYLAGGGDNFFDSTMAGDYITLDLQADVLLTYLATNNPINTILDGRISII
ncbi:hypothetical protein KVR01_010951 [Diaporthe batatas]|uniref:uncharacterized protein n=1 Tax=Diaporthe batatas TaxID=748121 RepID=UPI001D0439A2|nr:uncharacterized protein KVR01_010951 [Diaporthe batatas]KAG8159290.1 hypothetical protein KVR01_010951 [Diaporthe batatas]